MSEKKEKLFYTMGEVAEMFDVNHSLLRFWEQRFDILKPKKNKKGNRLFTPKDIKNLEMIYHLVKERGMTLAGAEKYLRENTIELERDTEIVRRLQEIRSVLVEIREELKDEEAASESTAAMNREKVAGRQDAKDLPLPFFAQELFPTDGIQRQENAESAAEEKIDDSSKILPENNPQQSLF